MSEQTLTERVASITRDRRAWIPFAVIGVLLLVLSTMVIVSVETREDPEPEIDEQLAYDRGEATAGTALQSAVKDAAAAAGDAPVTEATETDALRSAHLDSYLDRHDADSWDDLSEKQRDDHVFRNYVRLLIYQHAQDQFDGAGQEIRGVETRLSIPELDAGPSLDAWANGTEALERVDLTVGYRSSDLDVGKLRVSLDDVRVKVLKDDELIDSRVTTVETTVGTTLFELHNRTQRYDELLNMGFFEGLGPALDEGSFTGMGQEMALRLYPLAYAKSAVKYFRPDWFSQLFTNTQNQILTNHALYSLQKDAFGVTDPHSTTELRIYTTCFALNLVESKLPSPSEIIANQTLDVSQNVTENVNNIINNSNVSKKIGNVTAKAINKTVDKPPDKLTTFICNELKESYGEETDDNNDLPSLSDLPTLGDLLNGLKQDDEMRQGEVYLTAETPAALGYRELTEGSLDPDDGSKIGDPDPSDWQDELDLEPLVTASEDVTDGEDSVEVNESMSGVRENILSNFYETLEEDDVDASRDIENIVGEVYTVEAMSDTDTSGPTSEVEWPDGPTGENWSETDSTENIDTSASVGISEKYTGIPDTEQTFYEVDISVTQEVELSRTWECTNENGSCGEITRTNDGTLTPEMTVTLGGEHSPDIDVDRASDRRIEYLYEAGGSAGPFGTPDNFVGVPETVVENAFGLSEFDDEDDLRSALTSRIEGTDDQITSDTIAAETEYTSVDGSDYDPLSQSENTTIQNWLESELTEMVYEDISEIGPTSGFPGGSLLNTSTDPTIERVAVDRETFLNDEDADLMSELHDSVDQAETDIIYQDLQETGSLTDSYETVPDLARAAVYEEYLDRLESGIDTAQHVRQEQAEDDGGILGKIADFLTGAAEDAVDEVIDGFFGPMLDFADEVVGKGLQDYDDEEPAYAETDMFESVTFEVHGSPTFLAGSDSRATTAAVRPSGEGGRFAGIDRETPLENTSGHLTMAPPDGTSYATMYTAYANPVPFPGLPLVPAFHVAQGSFWSVEIGGEYPRFEVSATAGDPSSTTSYVRENRSVSLEIDGQRRAIGHVDPINFDSRTIVAVLMPPGGSVGDGGPGTWGSPEKMANTLAGCSGTYNTHGPHYEPGGQYLRQYLPDNVKTYLDTFESTVEDINSKIPIIDPIPLSSIQSVEDQADCIAMQALGAFQGMGLLEDLPENPNGR